MLISQNVWGEYHHHPATQTPEVMYLHNTQAQTISSEMKKKKRSKHPQRMIHLILFFLHSARCLAETRKTSIRVFQTVTWLLSFWFPSPVSQSQVSNYLRLLCFFSLSICLLKWCAKLDLEVMELPTINGGPPPPPSTTWFRSKLQRLSASFPPLQALSDGFQRGAVPTGSEDSPGTNVKEELLCC